MNNMYLDTNHYKHFLVIDKCASKWINKKQGSVGDSIIAEMNF